MDKAEQERKTEQDDELYALLEKAILDERLCVSGELIQKTLRRVQDRAEKKPVRKYFVTLRYACAAAAALLVVVAGGVFFNRGGFGGNTKQSELCPEWDNSGRPARILEEDNSSHGLVPHGDVNGEKTQNPEIQVSSAEGLAHYMETDGADGWSSERFTVSEEFAAALAAAGYTVSAKEAEYWEHTKTSEDATDESTGEIDRKQEIISALYGAVPCGTEEGESIEEVPSGTPLYAAVKIETGQGVLWILLGEKLYLVEE